MEHLMFVPSTRLLDRIEYGDEIFHRYIGNDFGEVKLTEGGQDLVMNGQCTWKEFTEALGHKIVWIGENAYLDLYHLASVGGIINYSRALSVVAYADGTGNIHGEVWAASALQASTACNIFYRLLTTSGASTVESDSTTLASMAEIQSTTRGPVRPSCPFSGLALSQLIQQCPSLTHLYLKEFTLVEEIVRALWAGAGTNIEIILETCTMTISGTIALVESMRRNLGPTRLLCCNIPTDLLADGLRGNDNLKILKLCRREPITDEGDMCNLVQSLSQNHGLEELDFGQLHLCNNDWSVLCTSIARHPTLEHIDVGTSLQLCPYSYTQMTRRTEMLADMLKVNTVLRDITLTLQDHDQQILNDEIFPRLMINRYRPRIRAIRGTQDISVRAKLLGRALYSVNGNPTLLWIFLSSHKEHLLRGIQE